MENENKTPVSDFIKQHEIVFEKKYVWMESDPSEKGWKHFLWRIKMKKGAKKFCYDYKMGIGNISKETRAPSGRWKPGGDPLPPKDRDLAHDLVENARWSQMSLASINDDEGLEISEEVYRKICEIGNGTKHVLGPLFYKFAALERDDDY